MKRFIMVLLLLGMVAVLGCEKKETMSITGPTGQKASITFNK